MTADAIRELFNRRPFEPFVIRMSDGEAYEVRHPECLMVLKTKAILGSPEEDRTTHLALIHVNSVEILQSA